MTFSTAALAVFAAASASALIGGDLEILDASSNVLASIDLGTPTSAAAVVTMTGFPKSVSAGASGTAASARYRTSAGGDWKSGMSVGTSGAQVNLSSLTIAAGQTVTINSATLTHAGA